ERASRGHDVYNVVTAGLWVKRHLYGAGVSQPRRLVASPPRRLAASPPSDRRIPLVPTVSVSALVLTALFAFTQAPSTFDADPPMACASCEEWNRPQEPFRIFGNTYYVGAAGVSAVLVTSDEGHVLLDGGLSQTAPLIDANIRALGFRTEDVRLITVSHEHYDHVGGIAALQRASGAEVVAGA